MAVAPIVYTAPRKCGRKAGPGTSWRAPASLTHNPGVKRETSHSFTGVTNARGAQRKSPEDRPLRTPKWYVVVVVVVERTKLRTSLLQVEEKRKYAAPIVNSQLSSAGSLRAEEYPITKYTSIIC